MRNLILSKEEIINIVEQYYLKEEGKKVKASINSKKECIGIHEEDGCVTTISIKEEFNILGMRKEIVTIIRQDELKNILNILLKNEGYEVINLQYNDGIHSEWVGYGMNEHEIKRAYFNGITLILNSIKDSHKTRSRVL